MPRPLLAIGRWLPRGWSDLLLQFALFFVAYQGYQVVRGLIEGQQELAFANAERIVSWEKATGTFFEPGLQASLLDHTWLIELANWLYINTHFTVSVLFLAWLYLRRNENFYFVRNMFMIAMAIALVGYALFPTAPPRMLGEEGFVDTIAAFTAVNQDSHAISLLVNKYAAMPSMHIGFSTMIAGSAVLLVRNPLGRILWALYPVLVFWVIVITGNHYWLDAAAGLAAAAAAALLADRVLARARPGRWAFRPEPSAPPADRLAA